MLFWKRKLILAKVESTYGTDASPAPTDAMEAINVSITPMDGTDVARDTVTGRMEADATLPAELHQRLRYSVYMAPSGTAGTAPAWGRLLRACGMAETIVANTSVTYNPVSSGHEAVTHHMHIDGVRMAMPGCRGTATFRVDAQGIPMIEFEFIGLFVQPTAQTLPTGDFSAFQQPQVASKTNTPTFTIGGTALAMSRFSLAMNNALTPRFLVNREAILITDKAERLESTVDAEALATFNPFTTAAAGGNVAVSLVHGTSAGSIATLSVPKAQMMRPGAPTESDGVTQWPLNLTPLANAGNDQFTLVLT